MEETFKNLGRVFLPSIQYYIVGQSLPSHNYNSFPPSAPARSLTDERPQAEGSGQPGQSGSFPPPEGELVEAAAAGPDQHAGSRGHGSPSLPRRTVSRARISFQRISRQLRTWETSSDEVKCQCQLVEISHHPNCQISPGVCREASLPRAARLPSPARRGAQHITEVSPTSLASQHSPGLFSCADQAWPRPSPRHPALLSSDLEDLQDLGQDTPLFSCLQHSHLNTGQLAASTSV